MLANFADFEKVVIFGILGVFKSRFFSQKNCTVFLESFSV